MAQDSDYARWDIKPWASTITQVMRAERLCAQKVNDATPFPAGHDSKEISREFSDEQRTQLWKAEAAREVKVRIVERAGFQRILNAVDDLEDWPADDFAKITWVDIEVGRGGGYTPASAKLELGPEGLSIRLCGPDRTWTAGLRHQLTELLTPKRPLRPFWLVTDEVSVGAQLVVTYFIIAIAIGVPLKQTTKVPEGPRLALVFGVPAVIAGFMALVAFLLPVMELVPEGTSPKYQRWKAWITGSTVALVLGVAAGLITAVALGQR